MSTSIRPTRTALAMGLLAFALLASTAMATGAPAPTGNAAAAPAAANPAEPAGNVVYKWKDANGVSQYSQQKPPKGVKFEVMPIASAPPSQPSSPYVAPVDHSKASNF